MREAAKLPLLLKELHLSTLGKLRESVIQEAEKETWNYIKLLTVLCEHEITARHQKSSVASR